MQRKYFMGLEFKPLTDGDRYAYCDAPDDAMIAETPIQYDLDNSRCIQSTVIWTPATELSDEMIVEHVHSVPDFEFIECRVWAIQKGWV